MRVALGVAVVLATNLPAPQRVQTAPRTEAGALVPYEAAEQFGSAEPRVVPSSPCVPAVQVFNGAAPAAIPDDGTVSRQVVVSGAGQYLWDIDLTTFITHAFNGDLDITLTSPAGTTVTITTDNGGNDVNVFNGTLWDDQAGATNPPGAVTETTFVTNVVETPIAPEEALAAFRGENPNGTWTLTIVDDAAMDSGTLNSWSLTIASFAEPPLTTALSFTNTTPVAIPGGPATVSSTITVTGVTPWLTDLNVQTFITHTFAADIDMTLTSPAGTVVTLTTDNGGGNDNVFNGTVWTDQAGITNAPGAVTETVFANLVVETPLAAEEPLGAFLGEDPNGIWTLTIDDDAGGESGSLDSWSLTLALGACGTPAETVNWGNDDRAQAIAIQPDGKIVVAGAWDGSASDFALARYNPNLTLDTSFDGDDSFYGNGLVNLTFANVPPAPAFGGEEFATALALQPDGKIVVVGYTDADASGVVGTSNNFAIARLKSDGKLDTSFNGTGKVIVDFGFDDRASGVAVQYDGKIVVAGSIDGGSSDFALVRLNPNGSLDTTFNALVPPTPSNGAGRLSFGFGVATTEFVQGVAIDNPGRIVVVGYTNATGIGANDMAIARVTPTGELDSGFDTDGRFTVDFGFDDRATGVTIQPDNKPVVVGFDDGGSPDFCVLRLTTLGALDPTFNAGGVVPGRLDFSLGDDDFARAIARQPNGKFVVAGYSNSPGFANPNNFAVARVTADGTLDQTFNESGPIQGVEFFDVGLSDQARAVAVQGDGVILAAGFTAFIQADFALVRLGGLEPTLTLTDIYPSSGLTTGGTHVAIDGTGFLPGATVSIGGVPATNVTVVSPTRITAITGASIAGPANVTVTSGSPVTLPNGYTYLELPDPSTNTDIDGIPDLFELQMGLDPLDPYDGVLDWDQDGLTNIQEYLNSSHPRGFYTRYLAEGATGPFFNVQLALLNAGGIPAQTLLRFLKSDGTVVPLPVLLNGSTRATVDPETLPAVANAEFSTVVESDEPIVADRTMTWDPTGYGSHAETSVPSPALTWYLAEGATHSGFNLFYLLQNPNVVASNVQVTYLLPAPAAPIVENYVVPPNSRFNIWVDLIPALADTDVSAIITSTNSQPIIVERAMYLDSQGLLFGAGHESAGVTAPALDWFLAEGATGPYFDLFVLIANPNAADANITATFLLPDGSTFVKNYIVAANSRFNIWVDLEGPAVANNAVSTTITSTNAVPVIVERAMWWPGSSATWHEAHNSPGATSTGTLWALAEGEVTSDARALETYILLANTSAFAGTARVTLIFEDGTSVQRDFGMNPNSRTNVAVGIDFPEAVNRRFGALIQSLGGPPAQIVVERAMYSNASGVVWAAGTNALATKLQ